MLSMHNYCSLGLHVGALASFARGYWPSIQRTDRCEGQ
jgi:hypothetical protein